jgi:hypothetical protein
VSAPLAASKTDRNLCGEDDIRLTQSRRVEP